MKQVAELSPVEAAQASSAVQASQLAPAHPAGQTPEPARLAEAAARSEAEALQVQVSPEGVLPWRVETPAAAASDDDDDAEEEGASVEPATEPRTGADASPEALEIVPDEGEEEEEEEEGERGFLVVVAEALGGAAGAAGGSARAGHPEVQGAHCAAFSSFCWQLGPVKPQRQAQRAEAASPGGTAQRPLAPQPPSSEEEEASPEEEEQPSTADALRVAESQTKADPSEPSLRVNLGRKVMLSLLSVR